MPLVDGNETATNVAYAIILECFLCVRRCTPLHFSDICLIWFLVKATRKGETTLTRRVLNSPRVYWQRRHSFIVFAHWCIPSSYPLDPACRDPNFISIPFLLQSLRLPTLNFYPIIPFPHSRVETFIRIVCLCLLWAVL